jgi:hypothetical protein
MKGKCVRVVWRLAALSAAGLAGLAFAATPTWAQEAAKSAPTAAEIGQKLSDPTSDVWALFTEFDLQFSDGDANTGDPETSGAIIFQPILPIPLYGEGANAWNLITRPTIPLALGSKIPSGFNSFDSKSGLGDTFLPLLVSPPGGHWILGLGPTFYFPTSTSDDLGQRQFGIGPTAVVGYATKQFTTLIFPQYFFGIGSRGDQKDTPDLSRLSMLYGFWWNLDNAWQVGLAPTITYDNKATRGNKWNVPVGMMATKTMTFGTRHVKFQFGLEYSVVSQDDYGKRGLIRFNIIPVINSLIKNPIFGGG